MSDTDNKQEALNKELEAKFKEYNSSDAKSASPRKTIQKALVAYAKAGQKCREAIEAVEGYKEVVKNQPTYLDIDEVDKKLHPDQSEKLYNELVHQPYSGDNNEYHIWRYNELSATAGAAAGAATGGAELGCWEAGIGAGFTASWLPFGGTSPPHAATIDRVATSVVNRTIFI